MVQETDNHALNKYEPGDTDWTHSPDMDHIEERLVVRDTEANLGNYTPHATATFIATDTGAVYDGDGTNWNAATRELESVATETADIGGEQEAGYSPESRPLISNSETTVNVPADYGTVQAALDDLPLYLRHRYQITIDDGTYDEHVTIPSFISEIFRSGRANEAPSLVVDGNTTTPGNVVLRSIVGGACAGAIAIQGVQVDTDTTWGGEPAPLYFRECQRADLSDVNIAGGTDGVVAYASRIGLSTVDFGASVLTGDGVVVKHEGLLHEQKADATPASGNVAGYAYRVGSGHLDIRGNSSTLTGDAGRINYAQGRIHDSETERILAGDSSRGVTAVLSANFGFAAADSGTWLKLPFDTTQGDDAIGEFDTTANEFSPAIGGEYRFDAHAVISNIDSANFAAIRLRVNGSVTQATDQLRSTVGNEDIHVGFTKPLELTPSDTVSLEVVQTNGAGDEAVLSGNQRTWLATSYVGPT